MYLKEYHTLSQKILLLLHSGCYLFIFYYKKGRIAVAIRPLKEESVLRINPAADSNHHDQTGESKEYPCPWLGNRDEHG